MKYKIICDSSANLLSEHYHSSNVSFDSVPLSIYIDGKEYVDDENCDIEQMIHDMNNPSSKLSSSCPSPNEYLKHLEGADKFIIITISSRLSGSYNSAYIARNMYKNPDDVLVIDSKLVAGAMELIADEAFNLIEQGLDFEKIKEKLTKYRDERNLLFVLDKFDNLIKQGRVNKVVGFLATKFNIKPLCYGEEGVIKIKEKVRTIQGVLKRLVINIGHMCEVTKDKVLIISTGKYIGEGFDLARLDTLFVTMPIKWEGTLQQYVGRLHRENENKNEVHVYDFVDLKISIFERMFDTRLNNYHKFYYVGESKEEEQIIFSRKDYFKAIISDLANAKKSVSLFINYGFKDALDAFTKYIKVPVNIYTKLDFELEKNDLVKIHFKKVSINLIIIDEKIIYFGDLNPFMFKKDDSESLLRIIDNKYAKSLTHEIGADDVLIDLRVEE